MKFEPKTKAELAVKNLLPKGWYDFEVMDAQDKVSRAGNEMIAVKLRVFDPNGGEKHVYDYLMEAVPEKLFDFCESVGLIDKYQAGTLTAEDCVNRAAKVKIAIDDKNENYDPKNVAKAYAAVDAIKPAPAAAPEPDEDEIPF